jgi:hypothetical protein
MALSEFISQVKQGGLSVTNRFMVEMSPPVPIGQTKLQKVLMFCDGAQLPGMSYGTIQNRTFGEFRETPYEKLYDTVTLSFFVDKDMAVKGMFDDWMSFIQHPQSRKFRYYDEYTCDMTILVMSKDGHVTYRCKLFEAYPKSIGAVQMDYAAKDIMKLSVTMQYRNWRAVPVTTVSNAPESQRDLSVTSETLLNAHITDFRNTQKLWNGELEENLPQGIDGLPNRLITLVDAGKSRASSMLNPIRSLFA